MFISQGHDEIRSPASQATQIEGAALPKLRRD